jgi:hypothetical protein
MEDGLGSDAGGMGITVPERVAAELLKFFRVCKQVVNASGELARLLYPVTGVPALLNQLAESAFVAGRGVENQHR